MTKSAFHEFFMCLVVEGALKGSHLFFIGENTSGFSKQSSDTQ